MFLFLGTFGSSHINVQLEQELQPGQLFGLRRAGGADDGGAATEHHADVGGHPCAGARGLVQGPVPFHLG